MACLSKTVALTMLYTPGSENIPTLPVHWNSLFWPRHAAWRGNQKQSSALVTGGHTTGIGTAIGTAAVYIVGIGRAAVDQAAGRGEDHGHE